MREVIFLILAIFFEVVGATALKMSNGFSMPVPNALVIIGYIGSFYLLASALKKLPLSFAYASWAGIGTALTALVGIVLFDESADILKFLGLGLIIFGLVLLNTQRKPSSEHGTERKKIKTL